jgi:DNA repair ATPase RecN
MKIEITDLISEARSVLNEVNMAIPSYPMGTAPRQVLEETAVLLESLIWKLVHEDLKEVTGELKQQQSKLKEVTEQLEAEGAALTKITERIETVAKWIGSLVGLAVFCAGVII